MNTGALKPERVKAFKELMAQKERCKRVNQYQ